MSITRLTTFLVSHFSEKARWALDFSGVAYEERRLLPGPHLLVTRRLAKNSSVPILEHEGRAIQGSGSILDYVATELGRPDLEPDAPGAERARELEALADRAFGLGVQRICYFYLLDGERKDMIELFMQRGPWWGRAFYALAFPVVAKETRRMYDVTPERTLEAKSLFRTAMAQFDSALQGQRYLGGARPNRLDITVAALLAPLCRPPEHLVHWPELPAGLAEFALEFADRPTWLHVREMYRRHRGSPPQVDHHFES
ncbi:MAG TPA: glutathione S-transferase family protein [Polyangiaceae bacterium]|nr:glutathione S-transferase family protein [Polyangiaceae bacterium]